MKWARRAPPAHLLLALERPLWKALWLIMLRIQSVGRSYALRSGGQSVIGRRASLFRFVPAPLGLARRT